MVKKGYFVVVLLCIVYPFLYKGEVCPSTCKTACTDADGGCSTCDPGYYGRKCQHPLQCVTGKGGDYRGTKSITEDNVQCQAWSSQTPNTHNWKTLPASYENYCRNPNIKGESKPWCYHADPDASRYQHCDIPSCDAQCSAPVLEVSTDILNPPQNGFYIGVVASISNACGLGTVGERTCLSGRIWSDVFKCTDVPWCSKPGIIPKGHISPNQEEYNRNATITITCDIGYEVDGPTTLRCQDNKAWGPLPNCSLVQCPLPTLNSNTHIKNLTDEYRYQDVVEIGCDIGYSVVGQKNSSCQHDKTWGPTIPSCELVECHVPKLSDGGVILNSKTQFVYKDTIVISCELGYDLVGEPIVKCNSDGSWNGTFPTCLGNEEASSDSITIIVVLGSLLLIAILSFVIIAIVIIKRRRRTSEPKPKEEPIAIVCNEQSGSYTGLAVANDYYQQPMEQEQEYVFSEIEQVYANEDMEFSFPLFTLENAVEYVQDKKNQTDYFQDQFKEFISGLQKPSVEATKTDNIAKNRFENIYPYDHNRVHLEVQNDNPNSSYINASYIQGLDGATKYIAAQSPLSSTVTDFWRMVWEQDVGKIVMLTNTRAVSYCQDVRGKSSKHGDATVKLVDKDVYPDFTIRQLSVRKGSGNSRRIIQFHFTAWPDDGIPKCASSVAEFRRKVEGTSNSSKGPLIVHCSDGIGPTGTFIALDIIMTEIKRSGEADIVFSVQYLREQRTDMLLIEEQFTFLHDALIEESDYERFSITASGFQMKYKHLQITNPKTEKLYMENVFENLEKTSPILGEDPYENVGPIIQHHSVQGDASDEDSTSALNPFYLPGYRDEHAFIVTKTPAPSTVIDFLNLIIDQKVPCVVMLNKFVNEDCRVGLYWPQNGDCLRLAGNYMVRVLDEATTRGIKRLKLKISITDEKRAHVFTQFQVLNWSDKQHVPEDPSLFLRIMEYVDLLQRGESRQPIIMHCRNGSDKCGLLCTAFNIIDRLKFEQKVVIQHVIKQMRSRNSQIITNFVQFDFCYKVISAYFNENQTDSNCS